MIRGIILKLGVFTLPLLITGVIPNRKYKNNSNEKGYACAGGYSCTYWCYACLQVVIDGYSAPLTAGNFAKLVR